MFLFIPINWCQSDLKYNWHLCQRNPIRRQKKDGAVMIRVQFGGEGNRYKCADGVERSWNMDHFSFILMKSASSHRMKMNFLSHIVQSGSWYRPLGTMHSLSHLLQSPVTLYTPPASPLSRPHVCSDHDTLLLSNLCWLPIAYRTKDRPSVIFKDLHRLAFIISAQIDLVSIALTWPVLSCFYAPLTKLFPLPDSPSPPFFPISTLTDLTLDK